MSQVPARAVAPIDTSERNDAIDVLRGFAIFGILLVNFQGGVGTHHPGLDRAVIRALDLLVLNSFYPMFAMLFGAGVALQVHRARTRGSDPVQLLVRRMAVLLMIGTAHAILLWSGDILVDYALIGSALILLQFFPRRALVAIVIVLTMSSAARAHLRSPEPSQTEVARQQAELAFANERESLMSAENRAYRYGGDYGFYLSRRWFQYVGRIAAYADWRRLLSRDLLALMLIGYLVGSSGWIRQNSSSSTAFLTAGIAGGVCAIGGALANRVFGVSADFARVAWMLENYGTTVFYVAMIYPAALRPGPVRAALSVFAPVGRMALTNYLAQSAIMTWLFMTYGLARAVPSALGWLGLNALFFVVQIAMSQMWLSRWRFGPAEWAWRSLSYGRLQPMTLTGPHRSRQSSRSAHEDVPAPV